MRSSANCYYYYHAANELILQHLSGWSMQRKFAETQSVTLENRHRIDPITARWNAAARCQRVFRLAGPMSIFAKVSCESG
jgi:hypothetical protein